MKTNDKTRETCDCFDPEPDNPYPLCVGKGDPACDTCNRYKDMAFEGWTRDDY